MKKKVTSRCIGKYRIAFVENPRSNIAIILFSKTSVLTLLAIVTIYYILITFVCLLIICIYMQIYAQEISVCGKVVTEIFVRGGGPKLIGRTFF